MDNNQIGRLVLWIIGFVTFSFFWGWVVDDVSASKFAYLAAPSVYLIFTWDWFKRWFLDPDGRQYEIGYQDATDTYVQRTGKWLIWSNKYQGWWRSGALGYTEKRDFAGWCTFEEACSIVREANRFVSENDPPLETMVQI